MIKAEPVLTKPENWGKLSDPQYRHALAMAQFKRFVPFQIGSLRRERQWSQEKLAEESGLTQGAISRAEDPDNGNLTVNTILRIANGLDVVFVGKFVPYTEFEEWRRSLSDHAVVLGFEKENNKYERESASARSFQQSDNNASAKDNSASEKKANNLIVLEKAISGDEQAMSDDRLAKAAGGRR
jgi:transcriptional regulator with XRE-family HTH domain